MARIIGRPSSDGSHCTININSTNLSPCPPGDLLKIDLRLKHTSILHSQHGNPSQSRELFHFNFPTLQLYSPLSRAVYSSALHRWLQLTLQGDVVNIITDHVIEHVFENIIVTLHEYFAIHVQVELHLVEPADRDWLDEIEEDDGVAGSGLCENCIELMMRVNRLPAPAKEELECRGLRDCSICLDDLVSGGGEDKTNDLFESRRCGHIFHGECMKKWLRISDSCPLCRFVVSPEIKHS